MLSDDNADQTTIDEALDALKQAVDDLVKTEDVQYAYLSNRDLYVDTGYEKHYGKKEISG